MQWNITLQIGTIGMLCLVTPPSLGGVTFTSRLSRAAEFGQTFGNHPEPDEHYGNTATYTQLGVWSITLPRGFSHTSNVSSESVSGSFASSYSESDFAYSSAHSTECSLEACFSVAGATVMATIAIDGSGSPAWHSVTQPEDLNSYVVIYNQDTNVVVFDSFEHGIYTFYNYLYPDSSIEWQGIAARARLPVGEYRLLVGAAHNQTWHPGPGMGWYANARLNTTIVFGCLADFDVSGLIDDADFLIFLAAYEVLFCEDPEMPAGCPADLNSDGLIDDADFQVFGRAFDELTCP